jgi:ketosteroid isomerase-like protein
MKKFLFPFILLVGINGVFAQKMADDQALKDLIQNSFDDIFSAHDKETVSKYYTDDFLLLEAGVVWNLDSIDHYLDRAKMRTKKVNRVNSFDFFQIKVTGKRGWIAYQNYANIIMDSKVVSKLHWLESATAIKTKKGWRLDMLHSTRVKDQT